MSDSAAKWASPDVAPEPRAALAATAKRYALSIAGPISISAAHFFASLIFLRELSPHDFGSFSFLLVVVPFLSISVGGSLLLSPLATKIAYDTTGDALSGLCKAGWFIAVGAGIATFAVFRVSETGTAIALILGAYGALMTLRWFGRGVIYAEGSAFYAMLSDVVYSVVLMLGLALLIFLGHFNFEETACVLLVASVLGTIALGPTFLVRQFWRLGSGTLSAYKNTWQDFSRWALAGVVLSELTANAHAYLVTFFSGPKAFAILAVGTLAMRPVSLVLSALPDLERPAMAKAIASGDTPLALRTVNEFRTAGSAIWLLTLLVAGAILLWFPDLLLKNGHYAVNDVLFVMAVFAAIMAARVLRTPESVLLQADGEFKSLATANASSGIISVVATLILLVVSGPLVASCGILIGELTMTAATLSLFRRWKARHV